ncbi:BTB/POZ domain-containing protein SR1IP1-like isoform X2 [Rhododendron vialii]|uniref:BTB/POZ domain-containing protein SR1IP1-like isoform X2 n=1 Tax=Rhododendron vialii TaxID=182163 RepID=UPI00265E2D36|nr:BTB/POZ domain-containing protein SR1IP1-like isoform X2 [Rhododendron vialii]
MADLDHEKIGQQPATNTVCAKKKELLSTAMKRTSEWIFTQEIPIDVIIHAGGTAFSLHKFPLVSKCGYIRKLVSQSTNDNLCTIQLPDVPGGAEAFELAAKFCYGVNFEITIENIAMLRCAAEYLEMTEEYAVRNLVGRTEAYLNDVALKSIAGAVCILHSTQNLIPIAEEVKLVSRCIDTIAYLACNDSRICEPNKGESGIEGVKCCSMDNLENIVDWWVEDLTVLRIDMFQRVLIAMVSRGFKQFALVPILMLYAQKSLQGLETFGNRRKKIDPRQEHEKRVVIETIVSLLPREKNSISVSFLSMLLKSAIHLQTTVASRLDLEKRIGLQLGQAVLDDLLIPSFSLTGDTLLDVDTAKRIVTYYIEFELEGSWLGYGHMGGDLLSPPTSDMERVRKLVESYLAEIASDRNLTVSKFRSVAELVPEQARVRDDGMYRAVDVYLKAHPALSETERKKVCSLMDCRKLSPEASAHAAQNDRLPVQTTVQVLYNEQQWLRHIINGSFTGTDECPDLPHKFNLHDATDFHPVSSELSSLKRENQELKIELVKMKMRLQGVEKPGDESALGSPSESSMASADKPRLARKSFISSVSRKLGRLYPFLLGGDGASTPSKDRITQGRDRRHSIS